MKELPTGWRELSHEEAQATIAKYERKAWRKVRWAQFNVLVSYFLTGYWTAEIARFLLKGAWVWAAVCVAFLVLAGCYNLRHDKEKLAQAGHHWATLFEWGRELADR